MYLFGVNIITSHAAAPDCLITWADRFQRVPSEDVSYYVCDLWLETPYKSDWVGMPTSTHPAFLSLFLCIVCCSGYILDFDRLEVMLVTRTIREGLLLLLQ